MRAPPSRSSTSSIVPAVAFACAVLAVHGLQRYFRCGNDVSSKNRKATATDTSSKQEEDETIKTMDLYNNVERIFRQLEHAGFTRDKPLEVAFLSTLDQYHYLGTVACDHAISELKLNRVPPKGWNVKVLDVGSGIGGPARYLAKTAGCHVVALEIQTDLHTTASELTERCGLSDRVTHVNGDILDSTLSATLHESFDHIVSWLVFLHIPDREVLLHNCFRALKPGGTAFIEDFMFLGLPLSKSDTHDLDKDVFCSYLPSKAQYQTQLTNAGFVDIEFEDLTVAWRDFVLGRMQAYVTDFGSHTDVVGATTAAALRHFYVVIDRLFRGGSVGGVKVSCRRPLDNELPVSSLPESDATSSPGAVIRTFSDKGMRLRAGCVCRRETDGKILLVGTSKKNDKWTLPAGGVDPGEAAIDAAARESKEEGGVEGVLNECIGVFKRLDNKKTSTSMWVLDVETELKNGYEDAGLRPRKWVSLSSAIELFGAEDGEGSRQKVEILRAAQIILALRDL